MAKLVRNEGSSTGLVIGARAFAAAGALTAAHWDPANESAEAALGSIVRTSGSGPISWQHPSSGDMFSAISLSEQQLAEAWERAFSETASDKKSAARLSIDTQSFTKAGTTLQAGLIDTYRKLIFPWMEKLDDNQPGQIAALSFTAFDNADSHDWGWPIRVGVSQQHYHPLTEKLNSARGVRRDFMSVVSSETLDTDVLLVPVSIPEPSIDALSILNRLPRGLTIVYRSDSPFDTVGHLVRHVSDTLSAPTALVDVPEKSVPKFLNEFTDEIAHNKPLDVALFDAYRNIFKGNRSGDIAPLVLLAPRTDQGTTFGNVQLENRVKELIDRLDRLPSGAVVGVPTASVQKSLGIRKSSRTVDDYQAGLSQAIQNDELVFERELDGGKALRSTTKAIEKLETRLWFGQTGRTRYEVRADFELPKGAFESVSRESADAPTDESFTAYPRLDAPSTTDAEKTFDFEVGFSDIPDPSSVDPQKRITIPEAHEGEDLLVVVAAENGRIIGINFAKLKLKHDAAAKFTVQPSPIAISCASARSICFEMS